MSFDGIRHTASFPCSICGGYQEMRKGKKERCYGITSRDRQWCVCTREEYRGALTLNSGTSGYHHLLDGRCACGDTHGDSVSYKPFLSQTESIKDDDRAELSLRIWRGTVSAEGSLVESYLRDRGIDAPVPPALRFAPSLYHSSGQNYPAMVAAVSFWPSRAVTGIHRTFLSDSGIGKADVTPNRMMLGKIGGGAVCLAPPGETLVIGEGIETSLSVHQATGLPTWAALSASLFEPLVLPELPLAKKVVIAADNDDGGTGLEAARKARELWRSQGRKVFLASPAPGKDFNDELLEAK